MPTLELPTSLYSTDGSRAIDRLALAQDDLPEGALMERAGAAALAVLRQQFPAARRLLICCGGGNNGGDGYVVARLAAEAGLAPVLLPVVPETALRGEAALMAAQTERVPRIALADLPAALNNTDLVVDALLGTGLASRVRADMATVIGCLNAGHRPVLSLDIPSGLNADTGAVMGLAVRASATITFICVKQGLLTGEGRDHCGQLWFDDLDVLPGDYTAVPVSCHRPSPALLSDWLPRRQRGGHKGRYGHVLVIGGDHGYGGAVIMAAQAAGRSGAGLVSVATRPEHCAPLLTRQPEMMVRGVEDTADLAPLLARASVVVIGPGLGQEKWGRTLLRAALDSALPLVVDADALNLLCDAVDFTPRANWVLTPHPGEAARLLDTDTASVQRDRFAALAALQAETGGTVLLKGVGTLIGSDGQGPALISYGNPGMGTGGMGDVLSGMIGGLLAQGLPPAAAATCGALAHALAGDRVAVAQGERGMLATDLLSHLPRILNP